MTELAFHFNLPDKLSYACRLLRKASRAGARVVVTGEAEQLQQLDVALWTFAPLEFVSHCTAQAPAQMVQASAVVLARDLEQTPHTQILLNLGAEVPRGFERFERLIELVSQQDVDRQAARARWRHYAGRGYAMVRHDWRREGGAEGKPALNQALSQDAGQEPPAEQGQEIHHG